MAELSVRIERIPDSPRDFWLAELKGLEPTEESGGAGMLACATGDTIPDALEELARRMRLIAMRLVEKDLVR